MSNVTVNDIYTTSNGGKSDGAMTLTCTDGNGNRSPFISIVKEFEILFNTTIPNSYARRDELLGRGESRVRFIRELLRSLGAE